MVRTAGNFRQISYRFHESSPALCVKGVCGSLRSHAACKSFPRKTNATDTALTFTDTFAPQKSTKTEQSLPLTAAPEVFGLHDNASITRAQSDTAQLLKSVLLTESSGGGSGGADKETTINTVAADILSKVRSKPHKHCEQHAIMLFMFLRNPPSTWLDNQVNP